MNEMYKGTKVNKFPPIQIQQPSMQTVLAMLNIINGILFVPSHEEEINRIREELNRLQQNSTLGAAEATAALKAKQQENEPVKADKPDYIKSNPIAAVHDDELQ